MPKSCGIPLNKNKREIKVLSFKKIILIYVHTYVVTIMQKLSRFPETW